MNKSIRHTASPWLTVIGLGDDGLTGLLLEARRALKKAVHVFGAQRHLASLNASCTPQAQRHSWPVPLSEGLQALLAYRYTQGVVVLVSGDPFHYGLGRWLACHMVPEEMTVMPGLSSITHACARLGWSQQDIDIVSLHGRNEHGLNRWLEDGRRLLVLTSDGEAPARIAKQLVNKGFSRSRLTLLEALKGRRERCRYYKVEAFAAAPAGDIHALNIMALDLVSDAPAECHGLAPGRPDALFEHDGQITRRDIRAMTLARLQPHPGQCLWDIGAGSGAVSVEWLRLHVDMKAVAIERHIGRCQHIRHNAITFGVPHLVLIEQDLQCGLGILDTLISPDAIFIGGGASHEIVDYAMARLAVGGRLVINAVTLETEQLVHALHANYGGTLHRVGMEYVEPLGRMRGWRPSRTITQWCWQA